MRHAICSLVHPENTIRSLARDVQQLFRANIDFSGIKAELDAWLNFKGRAAYASRLITHKALSNFFQNVLKAPLPLPLLSLFNEFSFRIFLRPRHR
jgi:hypothetical protein